MKVVCEMVINGEAVVKSYTTSAGTAAGVVKTRPGVGQPFWAWPTIPVGTLVGADFTGAPIVSSNTQENQAAIDAITVAPETVLIYEGG